MVFRPSRLIRYDRALIPRYGFTSIALGLLLLAAGCGPGSTSSPGDSSIRSAPDPDRSGDRTPLPSAAAFRRHVLRVMRSYPTDGTYGYNWPEETAIHGVTRPLTYHDTVIAHPGTGARRSNTYCSGVTFELFFRSFRRWCRKTGHPFSIAGLSAGELQRLRTLWYGADRSMSWAQRKRTVQTAVVEMGIGRAVERLEDAAPGDYIQFWRETADGDPSGHTALFLGWIRHDDGRLRGVRYWSSQSSTNGIGIHREFLDRGPAPIDRDQVYIARIGRPASAGGSDR